MEQSSDLQTRLRNLQEECLEAGRAEAQAENVTRHARQHKHTLYKAYQELYAEYKQAEGKQ